MARTAVHAISKLTILDLFPSKLTPPRYVVWLTHYKQISGDERKRFQVPWEAFFVRIILGIDARL
jgi:hypothetical protein